ncbi:MAG: EAL domain-containing protein [Pseudomonadota bacterium]|nr:EAL domain-containing protein [Pseudomonadota bacterium]
MISPTIQTLFQLSKLPRLTITLLGVVWLSIILAHEATTQYNQVNAIIQQKIQVMVQQQQVEHKRSETLLNALSEYYTSQAVKSHADFGEFANGLLKNSRTDNTIGLAELISREKQHQVEEYQRGLGFESFSISNSALFSQQEQNSRLAFLAITSITPLDPKHSIYLSEDLFTIPQIVSKFMDSVQNNQVQTLLLRENSNNKIQKLVFKPIFLNSPNLLTYEQRLKQVRGIVFILQPLEAPLLQQANSFFGQAYSEIKLKVPNNFDTAPIQIIQESTVEDSWLDQWLNLKTTSNLPKSETFDHTKIEFIHSWQVRNLDKVAMIKTFVIALMVYALLTLVILLITGYTKNLRQTQNRLSQLLETSQDAVIITDIKGYIIDWNPEAEHIFDYKKEEAIGQCITCLIFDNPKNLSPDNESFEKELIETFTKSLNITSADTKPHKTEVKLHNRTGDSITTEVATSFMKVKNKTEVSLFIKDITYQRKTEEAITKMAYFDPLTQLENRTFFKTSIDKIIEHSPEKHMALLFLDLDGFKQVNDTLGHSVGDELLKVVAKRIQNALRSNHSSNHICRFGGDEFIIMLDNMDETSASQVSTRLLNQIERVIKIGDDELQVSASIGIALFPDHGEDVDTLLRHADTAMYQSKGLGKNTYSIYHDSMEEDLAERILIEKQLRSAIHNREFSLAYQPQINLKTGQITGVEALIRWNSPILGFVPPDKFIPIAEETNLILNIGEWVTQTCIQQLEAWKNTRFDSLHIAMNVSSVQFENLHFLSFVNKLMENAGVHNHLLEIELTERTVMNNADENIARFNQIRANGFGLSVDDFGTGYSSLSYLKKFPLSVLKIDKTFVDGIPGEEEDISIATAILKLAHSLNMNVVAEGVETLEQLEYLKNLECNLAQGYYISRPVPIKELEEWLTNNNSNFYQNNPTESLQNNHA